jgi:hypothetical protein
MLHEPWRDAVAAPDVDNVVGFDGTKLFARAVDPLHRDAIDFADLAEADVHTGIVGGQVAIARTHVASQRFRAGRDRQHGADGITAARFEHA